MPGSPESLGPAHHPQLHFNIIMKNYPPPQGPEIIDFGGLDGPGGSKNNSKGCGANEAPHLLEWFLGAPGPSRPLTTMVSGSWGGVHVYINTKLGLPGVLRRPAAIPGQEAQEGVCCQRGQAGHDVACDAAHAPLSRSPWEHHAHSAEIVGGR